jgi:hypothetical protein
MELGRKSWGVVGIILAVTTIVLGGCSDDDSSSSGEATLDDNQKLSTLSDAQLGALCDWSNTQQGGYGKSTQCGAIMVTTQKDQAACKAEDGPTLMKCEQTVGVYKACTLKIAAGNQCDISGALASKECQPLLPCLTGG